MNISEIFIHRPVMTTLIMISCLIFGIYGYMNMPVSDLPNVDFPTIIVRAELPGASPDTMASSVSAPLEKQFANIAGIDAITSNSFSGVTQIFLQFNFSRDIDSAAQDVQAAIFQAQSELPALPHQPVYQKINPSALPIMYITLSSSRLPLSVVDEYAETTLARRISTISGVARVNVLGSQKYAVRVQADPDMLAAYQIGLSDLIKSIQQNNVNSATGELNGGVKQSFLLKVDGHLDRALDYNTLIVTYKNGSPVYLNTLAHVIDSVENDKVGSWNNGVRGFMITVQRQPGTNTIEISNSIKKLLPAFEKQLPSDIKLQVFSDRSDSINDSINNVKATLILATILVTLVIFIFLNNLRATLVTCAALPLSIFTAFAVMHKAGFTMDNLSLLALTLVVGFVIDDAIVMLENIFRHYELGENPQEAALKGSKEIGFTIVSMTLSLSVVFLPILLLGGLVGKLLYEFAVTICTAILVSGFIALSLTPMLCSRFLNRESLAPSGDSVWSYFNRVSFPVVTNMYAKSLKWALQHRKLTMNLFGITILLTIVAFIFVPKGFMPNDESGILTGYTQADPSVSFQEMSRRQQKLVDIIQKDPNVEGVVSNVGMGGITPTKNSGNLYIRLKPINQRKLNSSEVIQELRPKLARIPGIAIFFHTSTSISVGPLTSGQYQFTLQDNNLDELSYWSNIFLKKISALPGFQDVTSDQVATGPQLHISINRSKASALGVSAAEIENTLGQAYGSQKISTIYTSTNNYEVILELQPTSQTNPDALSHVYVNSSSGKMIPLSTLVTITQGFGPLAINHEAQLPAVTISFNLNPDVPLGSAVKAVQKLKNKLHPPSTLMANFAGTAQAFQSALLGLFLLLFLSVFVIYVVLGILYESFIHPLTIISGLPVAGLGAIFALLLFHIDLNFYSFLGIIVLVGIVKKNAIMLVDFALDAQKNKHMPPLEAIYQACLIRFRPIMMTTMAAIFGTLPVALAFGAGAEIRRPLGVAIVGGLLLSQLLTLYITPIIYLYFEDLNKRVKKQ